MPRRREPPLRQFRAGARRQSPVKALFPIASARPGPDSMASTLLHLGALIFFPALMALSASMDLLTFTIPNRICASLALGYLVACGAARRSGRGYPPQSVLRPGDPCSGVRHVQSRLGRRRGRQAGGGDRHMARLEFDPRLWPRRRNLRRHIDARHPGCANGAFAPALARFAWVTRLHDCKSGVPYGIALAAAGLMQYPGSGIWAAAV